MTTHLVLGAGEIGKPLVRLLVNRGDDVIVGTRSGHEIRGAQSVRLQASDPEAVATAARDAATIFLCTNPPYPDWARDWPPVFSAVVEAARRTGAALVSMGNLYPYGQVTTPMDEHTVEATTESKGLIRKNGWATIRSASERGDIRAVEVRASDYFGPGAAATAHLGERFFGPLLSGGTARVVGDPGQVHSWSYLPDIARTLVAAADYRGDWSRIWHVPSHALSRTEIADQIAALTGRRGRVVGYPRALLTALGWVSPLMREVNASSYQFRGAPFVIEATETSALLNVTATPWDEAFAATSASYRSSES